MTPEPHDPFQIYYNRTSAGNKLAQVVIEGIHQLKLDASTLTMMTCYCIDAIDEIPAGSSRASHLGPIQNYIYRHDFGQTEQTNAWAKQAAVWYLSRLEAGLPLR